MVDIAGLDKRSLLLALWERAPTDPRPWNIGRVIAESEYKQAVSGKVRTVSGKMLNVDLSGDTAYSQSYDFFCGKGAFAEAVAKVKSGEVRYQYPYVPPKLKQVILAPVTRDPPVTKKRKVVRLKLVKPKEKAKDKETEKHSFGQRQKTSTPFTPNAFSRPRRDPPKEQEQNTHIEEFSASDGGFSRPWQRMDRPHQGWQSSRRKDNDDPFGGPCGLSALCTSQDWGEFESRRFGGRSFY